MKRLARNWTALFTVCLIWGLVGCAEIERDIEVKQQAIMAIQDPTERGLAYIAASIIIAAIIRGIFNK